MTTRDVSPFEPRSHEERKVVRLVHSPQAGGTRPCTGLWTTSVDSRGARLARMSMTVTLVTAEEALRELPLPPWTYGAMALAGFAFLLGVTWSFRGTAQKYARPDLEGERHDATATGPANPGTGPTTADEDSPHWPEHPAHH